MEIEEVPTGTLHPLTDLGNAMRLAQRCRGKIAHVHGIGWMYYAAGRWQADRLHIVQQEAKEVVRDILLEAAQAKDSALRLNLTKWAQTTQSAGKIEAMTRLAVGELAMLSEAFDRDPWLLNCANGTLDLRTGELRPHEAGDYLTRMAPVAFDPEAACPTFDAFLRRIFADDKALIGWVMCFLGYCLTGDIRTQIMAVFYGGGANGKSTLLDLMAHVMGDYYGTAPETLLMKGKRDEHPTEIADLQGRRLVVGSETEAGCRLKTQLVKRLTGDTRMKGRRMREDFYEFDRTHKLVLMSNNRPVIREDTEAMWRRIRLVPFNVTIPEAERDPMLLDKLKAEAPGVLNLLTLACRAWIANGYTNPPCPAIEEATAHYREESDPIGEFLDERCIMAPDASAVSGDIRRAYEEWCTERGEHPMSGKALWNYLEKRGCTPHRTWNIRTWRGLGLRNTSPAIVGSEVEHENDPQTAIF